MTNCQKRAALRAHIRQAHAGFADRLREMRLVAMASNYELDFMLDAIGQ